MLVNMMLDNCACQDRDDLGITLCTRHFIWIAYPVIHREEPPPLGYDVVDRKLVTNPKEVELVNIIFDRFAALGSIALLAQELNKAGHRTKHYISRTGKPVGGKPFTENPLRTFLQNRLFLGEVHHKGKYYPGQHQPIITQAQFDAVQAIFAENSKGKRKRTFQAKSKALLKGILVCGGCGGAMSPTHTKKGKKNSRS